MYHESENWRYTLCESEPGNTIRVGGMKQLRKHLIELVRLSLGLKGVELIVEP
jgi:hypothetical protein